MTYDRNKPGNRKKEKQTEEALRSLEMQDDIEQALEKYLEAETRLNALDVTRENSAHSEYQRILSYCLMRQGNILRDD